LGFMKGKDQREKRRGGSGPSNTSLSGKLVTWGCGDPACQQLGEGAGNLGDQERCWERNDWGGGFQKLPNLRGRQHERKNLSRKKKRIWENA